MAFIIEIETNFQMLLYVNKHADSEFCISKFIISIFILVFRKIGKQIKKYSKNEPRS